MSIRMEVWGEYALFTRPEMKAERVSYDVITPSAAPGTAGICILAPWTQVEYLQHSSLRTH